MTTWILFSILGTMNPTLTFLASYRDEAVCKQAMQLLHDNKVKSVCIPVQPENKK